MTALLMFFAGLFTGVLLVAGIAAMAIAKHSNDAEDYSRWMDHQ